MKNIILGKLIVSMFDFRLGLAHVSNTMPGESLAFMGNLSWEIYAMLVVMDIYLVYIDSMFLRNASTCTKEMDIALNMPRSSSG